MQATNTSVRAAAPIINTASSSRNWLEVHNVVSVHAVVPLVLIPLCVVRAQVCLIGVVLVLLASSVGLLLRVQHIERELNA